MSRDGRTPLLERVAGAIAWRVLVGTLYPTGLTLLIPALALRLLPPELELVAPGAPPALLWLGLLMVGAAFLLRLLATRSLGGTLAALGRLTFIPGLVGLLVAVFGREPLLAHLARTVPRFETVRGAAELYLDRAVPRVLYLTLGFFVLGAVLLAAGRALRRGPVPPR